MPDEIKYFSASDLYDNLYKQQSVEEEEKKSIAGPAFLKSRQLQLSSNALKKSTRLAYTSLGSQALIFVP